MADERKIILASMRALIDSFGCLDAVAEMLAARWGTSVCKGTLSKKLSGHLEFSILDIWALEDAVRSYPITQRLSRRKAAQDHGQGGCLVAQGAIVAKETGEAVAAIIQAAACTVSTETAIVEIGEAIEALRVAQGQLETQVFGRRSDV